MEPLSYYKWQWRDYRANRRVQRMSWQAKGLYRELLDEFWVEGSLPLDHSALADICGCTVEEFSHYWPEIEGCWEVTDGGLVNAKMDSMRTAVNMSRTLELRSKSGYQPRNRTRKSRVTPKGWGKIRVRIFERDSNTCFHCKSVIANPDCDHLIPLSLGGSSDDSNLVTSCPSCNRSRQDKLVEDWNVR